MDKLSSLHNERYKTWLKLLTTKGRKLQGRFIVEGEHLVEEAQKANLVERVLVREGRVFEGSKEVVELADNLIDRLCSTQSKEDVLAVCTYPIQRSFATKRILVCDRLQDSGNLGSLIRSARAFGYDAVLCSDEGVDPFHMKVIRASQGAIFHLPVLRVDLKSSLKALKAQGVFILGSGLDRAQRLETLEVPDACAVIVSHEGQGLDPHLRALCDAVVYIDAPLFESLNVAVAGGILMHYVRKKHTKV